MCLLGYTVAVNYNTADFANTGETPGVCIWLAIINCVTGLASIATLSIMGILSYHGVVKNEIAEQNRMSGKVEMLLISGERMKFPSIEGRRSQYIDQFRVALNLTMKATLTAKSLL